MRIYIESTIPSYVVARPSRDPLQAARQQLTREWWELRRHEHELFTSQTVLDEIAVGEAEMARRRLELMEGIPMIRESGDMRRLAGEILAARILPPDAGLDALHISLATVHGLALLLTWNCRHIANPAIQLRIGRLAEKSGLVLPVLCTPEELLEHEDEQGD